MLSVRSFGSGGPLVVMLHWLGGSARSWTETAEALAARGLRSAAIDLPGFGDSPRPELDHPTQPAPYALDATLAELLATLRVLRAGEFRQPWLLVGHSMGGKFATLLARAAVKRARGTQNLAGLVLVSASPPGPEPMKDARRSHLLDILGLSTGDAEQDRDRAAEFLAENTGRLPLAPALRERALADILRMSRPAFTAWLTTELLSAAPALPDALSETDPSTAPEAASAGASPLPRGLRAAVRRPLAGSQDDRSRQVGVLPYPALVVAGAEDAALGEDAQRRLLLPHFDERLTELVVLEGCGHLAPLERPRQLAELIADFAQRTCIASLGVVLEPPVRPLSPAFRQLLASPRTSPSTREVLLGRLQAPLPGVWPFSPEELVTLRALVTAVLPDPGFDLVACLARVLSSPGGDGWRYDILPPDLDAWHTGLASLDAAAQREHGVPFIALDDALQHDLLLAAQHGDLGAKSLLGSLGIGASATLFNAAQMQRWLEEALAELSRLYVADPRTLDRIGFSGFADGTDPAGPDAGFTHIQLQQREPFERGEELLP